MSNSNETQGLITGNAEINDQMSDELVEASLETTNSRFFDIDQLTSIVEAGDPVIIILILMPLVALTVFINKYWQFLWVGLNRHKIIYQSLELWKSGQHKKAYKLLEGSRNPIAPVLNTAMSFQSRSINDDSAREEVMLSKATVELGSLSFENFRDHCDIESIDWFTGNSVRYHYSVSKSVRC